MLVAKKRQSRTKRLWLLPSDQPPQIPSQSFFVPTLPFTHCPVPNIKKVGDEIDNRPKTKLSTKANDLIKHKFPK